MSDPLLGTVSPFWGKVAIGIRVELSVSRGWNCFACERVLPLQPARLRSGRADMNLIIILIVGAVVGWLAGVIMRSGGGIIFDIVVGIVGALIAGFLFGGSILDAPLSVTAILYSLVGAIILLAIYKLVTRASAGRR